MIRTPRTYRSCKNDIEKMKEKRPFTIDHKKLKLMNGFGSTKVYCTVVLSYIFYGLAKHKKHIFGKASADELQAEW
jgi:hypothetical protein